MTKFVIAVLAASRSCNQRCQLPAINRPTLVQSRILMSRTLIRITTSMVHPLRRPSWATERLLISSTRRRSSLRAPRRAVN